MVWAVWNIPDGMVGGCNRTPPVTAGAIPTMKLGAELPDPTGVYPVARYGCNPHLRSVGLAQWLQVRECIIHIWAGLKYLGNTLPFFFASSILHSLCWWDFPTIHNGVYQLSILPTHIFFIFVFIFIWVIASPPSFPAYTNLLPWWSIYNHILYILYHQLTIYVKHNKCNQFIHFYGNFKF